MSSREVMLGVAMLLVVVLAFTVFEIRNWEAIYKEMGGGALPELTQVVLGSAWRIGVPLAAVGAVGLLAARSPVSVVPYIVTVSALLAAIAMTWYGIRMPIWQLAGNIQ